MFFSWPGSKQTAATQAAGERQIALGQQQISYHLLRSQRRSIGLQISPQGLKITAPHGVNLSAIEDAIRSKQNWILDKLAQRAAQEAARAPQFEWGDGAQLPFLGQNIRIRIENGPGLPALLQTTADGGRELLLRFPQTPTPAKIRQRVGTWLQAQAEHLFVQRLQHYAPLMQSNWTELSLSNARTQWGSCSAQGKIRLNWRLIHFDLALLDYVVVHELAHRHEMNHSPRFWAHVARLCPNYKQLRHDLTQASRRLPPGL